MEITGKIANITALEEVGKNGLKKRSVQIKTQNGNYEKDVIVTLIKDVAEKFNGKIGQSVTFSFDIESREYNGRWYTDVKAWKYTMAAEQAPAPSNNDFTF